MQSGIRLSWSGYASYFAACIGLWILGMVLPSMMHDIHLWMATQDYRALVFMFWPLLFSLTLVAISPWLYRSRNWARSITIWLLSIWLGGTAVLLVGLIFKKFVGFTWSGFLNQLYFPSLAFIFFPALLLLLLVMQPVASSFRPTGELDVQTHAPENNTHGTA